MKGNHNSTPATESQGYSPNCVGFDDLYNTRIENARDKKRILATKTPFWRIRKNVDRALDTLQTVFFQSHIFNRHVANLIETNDGRLELPHPKHQKTVLILTTDGSAINLTCPHLEGLTTKSKLEPPLFELTLKVCRRLQNPISLFDYFLEVFGEPGQV